MREDIRAFVAVELPEEVQAGLARQVEALRRADLRGLRLVRPEAVHLTLKFLGQVPSSATAVISEAMSRVASGRQPFWLELAGAGTFPASRARVLWIGLAGDTQALALLHSDLEEALEGLGFAREPRSFSPHLTVARLREDVSVQDRRRAAQAHVAAWPGQGHRLQVHSLSLMQSHRRPEGAVYERLALAPLGHRTL